MAKISANGELGSKGCVKIPCTLLAVFTVKSFQNEKLKKKNISGIKRRLGFVEEIETILSSLLFSNMVFLA